jgi:hypothetical protein
MMLSNFEERYYYTTDIVESNLLDETSSFPRDSIIGYLSSFESDGLRPLCRGMIKGQYCKLVATDDEESINSLDKDLEKKTMIGFISSEFTDEACLAVYEHAKAHRHYYCVNEEESGVLDAMGSLPFLSILGFISPNKTDTYDLALYKHSHTFETDEARSIRLAEEARRNANPQYRREMELQETREKSYRIRHPF